MNAERENEAAHAYLKLLENKGAESDLLHNRSLFLDRLCPLLTGKALNRTNYGIALDALMKSMPAEEWHKDLVTAREFYPFWMGDIKAIAALNTKNEFYLKPIAWAPSQTTIKLLAEHINKESFGINETRDLKTYAQSLRNKGANEAVVKTRVNLAKVLLLQLRGAQHPDNKIYRKAVDLTLPLFKIDESKKLFLLVIREFYYFWSANENPPIQFQQ